MSGKERPGDVLRESARTTAALAVYGCGEPHNLALAYAFGPDGSFAADINAALSGDAVDLAALLHDNDFPWDWANAVNAVLSHHGLVVRRVSGASRMTQPQAHPEHRGRTL